MTKMSDRQHEIVFAEQLAEVDREIAYHDSICPTWDYAVDMMRWLAEKRELVEKRNCLLGGQA